MKQHGFSRLFVLILLACVLVPLLLIAPAQATENPGSGYVKMRLGWTNHAYWNSAGGTGEEYLSLFTNKSNSDQYIATRKFTRQELPIGSIIVLDAGWQYRPDGWVGSNKNTNATRPAATTAATITVTAEWWGDFTKRGFNISKKDGTALSSTDITNAKAAFRIYVPFSKSNFSRANIKWTNHAFWHSTNTAGNHNKQISDASNSKQYMSTQKFTKTDLPVGSMIFIDSGWEFRPEGWVDSNVQSSRPGVTDAHVTLIDDAWWGNKTSRAFNLSKTDGSDLTAADLEAGKEALRIWIPFSSGNYYTAKLEWTDYAYWNSAATNGSHLSQYASASNSKKFVSTQRFTKSQLPSGTVIQIASGWQYRPDGWADDGVQSNRADPTNINRIVVNSSWWGSDTTKGFNISKEDGTELTTADLATAKNAFKIYLPKSHTHSPVTTGGVAPTRTTTGMTGTTTCFICNQVIASPKVVPTLQDSFKLLMIGNSFSDDTIQYVYWMLQDLGVKEIVLGNLYIGGCSLDTHWTNAKGNKAEYKYREFKNGAWVTTDSYKMKDAIKAQEWNFISMQQASPSSGMPDTYNNLSNMITYVRENCYNAQLVWNMTWAYQKDSTHSGFANYNKNQTTMYNKIIETAKSKIASNKAFYCIIPTGTAVQDARSSYIGDTLTRDGYHMSQPYGRYIVGLTLVNKLYGEVKNVEYAPDGVSAIQRLVAVESAINAVKTPYSVTKSAYTSSALKTSSYYFHIDYTNTLDDQAKYATTVYGNRNYDLARNYQVSDGLTAPVANSDGTLTFTVSKDAESGWLRLRDTVAGKYGCAINPKELEVVQIRFKAEGNYSGLEVHAIYATGGTSTYLMASAEKKGDGYVTLTLPVDRAIDSKGNLASIALQLVEPKAGLKVTVDYIYMGKLANAPACKGSHTVVTDAAVAATCTETGLSAGSHCSVCNAIITAQTVVPATGHSYTSKVTTAATCTASGVKTYSCSKCNHSYTETIAAIGHTEVADKAVAATCTTAGKTEGSHCSTCNAVIKAQTTVPAKGHTEVKDAAVAATCTTEGKTEGSHCSVCNTVTKAQTTVPATGHSYTSKVTTAATCTAEGVKTYTCSKCGDSYTEIIPAPGHTVVVDAAVPATCTNSGLTDGSHCSVCNVILVAQEGVSRLGHDYGNYVNNGDTHTATCSRCDKSQTSEHTYTNGACVCGAKEILPPVLDESIKILHTLDLASDISVTFAVQKTALANYDSYYLECVLPEYNGNALVGTSIVEVQPVVSGNYYYFTLTGITAVRMGDMVDAVLHMTKDGQEYISKTDSYSVATYAYGMLNSSKDAKMLTLCADLLRYGAEAQAFKGYRTDALVDADMTEVHRSYLSDTAALSFIATDSYLGDLASPTITWVGKTLDLGSKVGMKFVFNAKNYTGDLSELSMKVSYVGSTGETKSLTVTGIETYNAANKQYSFTFYGLLASELRTIVDVAIYEGDTQLSETLRYSAESYAAKTGTTALAALTKALFAYSDSAKSFFAK